MARSHTSIVPPTLGRSLRTIRILITLDNSLGRFVEIQAQIHIGIDLILNTGVACETDG